MRKFRRAIFCYYILHFDRGFHPWIASMKYSLKLNGLISLTSDHQQVAKWLTDLFDKKMDFDAILHILSGDAFYEQNKSDVAKLEAEVGKKVTAIWDTNPIFAKYPNLRGLARNKKFEEMWAKTKSDATQKTK